MLRIYGAPRSRAFRVVWLAEESGILYEHIPVTFDGESPQCKEAWYLALNPNGRVPAIDDDGFVMWESAAINLYLAEKYGSPLFPISLEAKGRMLQWAFFIANDVEPPLITALRNRVVFAPEERNPVLAEEAEASLRGKLTVLEGQLSRTRYFGHERWDMSDFMVACVLCILTRLALDLGPYPRLKE